MRFTFLVVAIAAFTTPALAQNDAAADTSTVNAPLALLVLIVAILGWFALRSFVRGFRSRKTAATVKGDFTGFALQALVNAAKIDGRVADSERAAIAAAAKELGAGDTDSVFATAKLSKDELVAYLTSNARSFTHEQKQWLLKSLLAVFVADGVFDESEHAALVDYTAAIGFDRAGAPGMLRNLARDFSRGNIT